MVRQNQSGVKIASADPIRWDGAADAFEHLGEPLASYGRLLLVEDDARQREQSAAFRQDHAARMAASLDREDAQTEIQRFRHHHVSSLLLVLRWAMEDNPAALAELIGIEVIRAAVMELEERVDAIEERA